MGDPRSPQLTPPLPLNWAPVYAAATTSVETFGMRGVLGGIDVFSDGQSIARRLLLTAQKSPVSNGIYETVAVGLNHFTPTDLPAESQGPPLYTFVLSGRAYRYVHHADVGRVENGNQTITGSCDFTAQGSWLAIYPTEAGESNPLLATLHQIGLQRTSDANTDLAFSDYGRRVDVLYGTNAGIWEFDSPGYGLVVGGDAIEFHRLGALPAVPADPFQPTTEYAPLIPALPDGGDTRPPATPQPPKPGSPAKNGGGSTTDTDTPTAAGPSVSLLGISAIVTVNGSPVTISDQPVTCIF